MFDKIVTAAAVLLLGGMVVETCSPKESPNVVLHYDVGEHFVTRENMNDPDAYREFYVIYNIENRDDDKSVSMLRFSCDASSETRYEEHDIPPHARYSGKLRIMNAAGLTNLDSCKPEYEMVSSK